jgi:TatD DNase family protein
MEGYPLSWMDASVAKLIVNGTSENDWQLVSELASDDRIRPAYGVHPWKIVHRSYSWKAKLIEYLEADPQALVGEIGIDKWIRMMDFDQQKLVFIEQLDLALERGLPPTIHCLKAWGTLKDLLNERRSQLIETGFLLHSYSGPAEMVAFFAELGAYFSISGYFAQPEKGKKLETWKRVPVERLLVETDAPDMLPPAFLRSPEYEASGKTLNHPANLAHIYDWAAEQWGFDQSAFCNQIETNFIQLFGT